MIWFISFLIETETEWNYVIPLDLGHESDWIDLLFQVGFSMQLGRNIIRKCIEQIVFEVNWLNGYASVSWKWGYYFEDGSNKHPCLWSSGFCFSHTMVSLMKILVMACRNQKH